MASKNAGRPARQLTAPRGWIQVLTIGQPQFERWVRLMGDSESECWLRSALQDDISRGNHAELVSSACTLVRRANHRAVPARARGGEAPVGVVYSPQQALDDPHVRAMASELVAIPACPSFAVADTPVRLWRRRTAFAIVRPSWASTPTDPARLGYGATGRPASAPSGVTRHYRLSTAAVECRATLWGFDSQSRAGSSSATAR